MNGKLEDSRNDRKETMQTFQQHSGGSVLYMVSPHSGHAIRPVLSSIKMDAMMSSHTAMVGVELNCHLRRSPEAGQVLAKCQLPLSLRLN